MDTDSLRYEKNVQTGMSAAQAAQMIKDAAGVHACGFDMLENAFLAGRACQRAVQGRSILGLYNAIKTLQDWHERRDAARASAPSA